jgi:CHAT domain-containing protein
MTEEEVKSIVASVGGISLAGHLAVKDSFLAKAKNYNMIHLATHASVNWKNPDLSVIHFSPVELRSSFLTLDELQRTWLPLEMTVLSACETGLGQLNKGEGLMSLARGFFAAGSKSVITSLWKADDESTYKIMTAFYKYLARGQRKDEALRNAKLEYLENCDPLKSSPFYWAAFIPIGDMSPIRPVPWHLRWWFWPCLVLMVVGMGAYAYRHLQSRRAA